jgi:hypothetical protein
MLQSKTPISPTPEQLGYLRFLAERTGTTFTPPRSIGQAHTMINEMKDRRRTSRAEIARERREVSGDMATRRGDAAKVSDRELAGYGSSATWAAPVEEGDPRIVHCKRDPFDVYIGRRPAPEGARAGSDGRWGNPFKAGRDGTRQEVIAKYERWLLDQPELMRQLPDLRGKIFGCWCAPKACHGDVLVRLSNASITTVPKPEQPSEEQPNPFLCYSVGAQRRMIIVQRVGGKISIQDLPADDGGGTGYLVADRTDNLKSCGELEDLITDYIRQTQRLRSIPLGPIEIDRIINAT